MKPSHEQAVRQANQLLAQLPDDALGELADMVRVRLREASWPPVTKLELFLTEDCNFRCLYCWVPKQPRRMSWYTAKRAIDALFHWSRDSERLAITLFGGEPLLEFDLMKRVVSYTERKARREGKTVGWMITTNASVLSHENAQFAAEHGILYLVSIDGTPEVHNLNRRTKRGKPSYDLVLRGIEVLKRQQNWLGARVTVVPGTVGRLAESVEHLLGVGFHQFIIAPVPDVRWSRDDLKELERQWNAVADLYIERRSAGLPMRCLTLEPDSQATPPNAWGCEAARNKVCVTSDGTIWPCARFVDSALDGSYVMGSLARGLIHDSVRADLCDGRVTIRGKCMQCGLRSECTGGCPATNLKLTGSIYVPPPIDCTAIKVMSRLRREHHEKLSALAKVRQGAVPESCSNE